MVRVAGILDKNTLQKLQRSKIHNLSSLSDTISPAKKIAHFPAGSAQHTDSTYLVPAPPAPTTYLAPHRWQSKAGSHTHSLVDTRRRTTVESAEARNGSWVMAWTRGVGRFRLISAPICMSRRWMLVRVWPWHARVLPAVPYPWAFQSQHGRSSSTAVSGWRGLCSGDYSSEASF